MSERGSFVTEYIYCTKCFKAAESVLIADDKYLKGVTIPVWSGSITECLPIIAGKVGGMREGEEFEVFENKLIPEICKIICHNIRIAVISDSDGERFFVAKPE